MRPGMKDEKKDAPPPIGGQIEIVKAMIAAAAEITSSMVRVTNEKNPAKICEAYKVIYKAVQETVKGAP